MAAVKFFISKKTWSKMVKHTCCGYSARFLTYVWPFFSVMKEKVKGLVMVARVLDARLLHSSHKNKAIRIHKYVCEASIRCKIQSFEEWLVEVNDASSPITQFQETQCSALFIPWRTRERSFWVLWTFWESDSKWVWPCCIILELLFGYDANIAWQTEITWDSWLELASTYH